MEKYSLSYPNRMFSSEEEFNQYAEHLVSHKVKTENSAINNLIDQFYGGNLNKMETYLSVKQELRIQYGQLIKN